MIRTDGLNFDQVIKDADAHLDDLDLQLRAADCEIAQGDFDASSSRLLIALKSLSGDDQKRARDHLLLIFSMIDPADPRLAKARQMLASTLF